MLAKQALCLFSTRQLFFEIPAICLVLHESSRKDCKNPNLLSLPQSEFADDWYWEAENQNVQNDV